MTASKTWLRTFCTIFAALCACPAYACEPVVPFIRIVAGPAILMGSAIALPIAICLKALLFAAQQKRLSYWLAVLLMVAGNILTTVVGIIVATMIGSGAAWIVGVPLVWLLCWLPSKRAVDISSRTWIHNLGPGFVAFLMTGALVISCFLFMLGQGAILTNRLITYWLIKFVAVYLALLVSILLSAFWEEWVVWRLSRLPESETFTTPVLRANLYVLLLMMAVAAAMMLPKRLKSPDFLVRGVRSVIAAVAR